MRHAPIHCFEKYAILVSIIAFFASGCATQQTYDSPDHAAEALVQNLRNWSADGLKKVLGPDGSDILSSGDEVADRNAAEKFIDAYNEKHQLVATSGDRVTLVVGRNEWPMPIPIVKSKNAWRFDSESGKEEIINRRIGRNELNVIEVCKAIVDAQRDYALANPNGEAVNVYAQKIISDPGKKNGLYWPTAEGESPSPLGPLVAEAVEEGYGRGASAIGDQPRPYHGYCYRLLRSQGTHAEGGAQEYIVNGRMIGGFAVVAYPADYGNSGIMTFIVSHKGVVYQKDLGDDTEDVAREMISFDPGPGWQAVPSESPAGSRHDQ